MTSGRTCEELVGRGLHTGVQVQVKLIAWDGPMAFKRGTEVVPLSRLRFESGFRATCLVDDAGTFRVSTVEHLFAALASRRIRSGCLIDLDAEELPLLGGGATEWCDALSRLALPPAPPRMRVAKDGDIDIARSRYSFRTEGGALSVTFETTHPELATHATWDGTKDDFEKRIAPARTFVFARDLDALADKGLASHAPRESVVVLSNNAAFSAGRPFERDEPARHKLLDLIGDLYVAGGPPKGGVHAVRPGHAANHAAVARAFELGILVQDR